MAAGLPPNEATPSATWATRTDGCVFACPCGAMFPAMRTQAVRLPAEAELAARLRERGPFDGHCPACGREAQGSAAWLELDTRAQRAQLVVPDDRRGDVLDILAAHLAWLRSDPSRAEAWLLQPELVFLGGGDTTARRTAPEETTAHRAVLRAAPRLDAPPPSPAPAPVAAHDEDLAPEPAVTREPPRPPPRHDASTPRPHPARAVAPGVPRLRPEPGTPIPITSGVPQAIGNDGIGGGLSRGAGIGAWIGELVPGATLVVRVQLDDEALGKWQAAKLDARPIHLRNRGYPLLGVRIVGAWMGQLGCIDGVVDVGRPEAIEVFRALSQRFALRLELVGSGGASGQRDVLALGLEANAALCLESARGMLAHGDHPPSQFRAACDALAIEGVEERLAQTKVTIAPGAYQHIVGASEAVRALDHLDRVSRKETLARLLEVEGLPMAEYDAIRRRVLAGSLEHGIVAPRRFWRRVVASGLAEDLGDYVVKLAQHREVHEGEEGDLDAAAAHEAWQSILDVCMRKDLKPPAPLRRALDLPETLPSPGSNAPVAAAGVIDVVDATSEPTLVARLADHRTRLGTASALLQSGRATPRELQHVFEALEHFDNDELLAILPDLSELGPRAVTGMVGKLNSERRELRQAAAILLGMSLDPDALGPLSDALVVEPTNVWLDVARALGGFGPIALRRLCQLLRRDAGSAREQTAIERVARALAEIALSDGLADGSPENGQARPGRDAVAALADAPDPRVSAAARRALATLRDVSESGAAIRGELPLAEVTEVRGFSRRAYEAIMVPELEVEAES